MRNSLSRSFVAIAAIGVLAVATAAAAPPVPFTEEALARGLDFTMGPWPQVQGFDGQGTGFVDLDNDGDPDVVVLGRASGVVGIFENIGGGVFVDRSATSGIPTMVEHEAFAAADYDADGRIDLYITQHALPNVLVRNLGGFLFTDVTSTALVGDDGPAAGASWGDFDGDGWLDLYVCNYSGFTPYNLNLLYRNNGDGTFTDVAAAQGVDSDGLSFQSVWTDYDKDGDLDLYLSNDRAPLGWEPNQLWRNDDGTLVDVSVSSGANVSLYSMGLAAGDFDGNGWPDYYVTNVNGTNYNGINPLLLNQGDGTFVESAEAAGVANWITSWGAIFFDFDNDTHLDLYVNNMYEPNSFFRNDGPFPCTESAAELQIESTHAGDGQAGSEVSFTSAVGDVDGDGDMDLLVNNVGTRAELFINNEGSSRGWIRYDVVGEHPNLFAVGVRTETTAGGKTLLFESYAGGNGYLGQNELVIHVGLDDATIVDRLDVQWPSGGPSRVLTDLPINETWKIYPPSRLCDVDGDGATDQPDFVAFADCLAEGFASGCEMMDFDGDSAIRLSDLDACFVDTSSDCNGNGMEDLVEIVHDLTLDGDEDGGIDCCGGGSTPFPNAVGPTLAIERSPGGDLELSWTAPVADGAHDPVDSYDVFRSSSGTVDGFARLANVGGTAYTDPAGPAVLDLYLVGARNGCGSSGEEPF